MANLKEVRERIKSVISTQQITKAMKMVSAAKFRKSQSAIVQLRPYADKINKMLSNIMANLDGDAVSDFGVQREVNRMLVVVITSNRGLCGAFNTNINKLVLNTLHEQYTDLLHAGKIDMMFISKKGYDFFRKRISNVTFHTEHINAFSDPSFNSISEISSAIMNSFAAKKYDKVLVGYGKFKNAATQIPSFEQYLPVEKFDQPTSEGKQMLADYIFEPDKYELLKDLIPGILKITFHKFVLDTIASEHGARMTAMDKATENAEDILKDLKINYNKARQEAITKELSEIVGGAAAQG
jgi:F-type H+-transporting ATPase subunit gamma